MPLNSDWHIINPKVGTGYNPDCILPTTNEDSASKSGEGSGISNQRPSPETHYPESSRVPKRKMRESSELTGRGPTTWLQKGEECSYTLAYKDEKALGKQWYFFSSETILCVNNQLFQ